MAFKSDKQRRGFFGVKFSRQRGRPLKIDRPPNVKIPSSTSKTIIIKSTVRLKSIDNKIDINKKKLKSDIHASPFKLGLERGKLNQKKKVLKREIDFAKRNRKEVSVEEKKRLEKKLEGSVRREENIRKVSVFERQVGAGLKDPTLRRRTKVALGLLPLTVVAGGVAGGVGGAVVGAGGVTSAVSSLKQANKDKKIIQSLQRSERIRISKKHPGLNDRQIKRLSNDSSILIFEKSFVK